MISKQCKVCNSDFEVYPSNGDAQFCSRDCYLGSNHNPSKQNSKKMVVSCDWCNDEIERIPSLVERTEYDFCDYQCVWNWRSENDGTGNSEFMGRNWADVRQNVIDRDGECQRCGEDGSNLTLEVHHKIPRRTFRKWDLPVEDSNKMTNLVTLCRRCHPKVEYGDATV